MRVFVTGATGWVGTATVAELLGAGHTVEGLSRSEDKAGALAAAGAAVLRGTLDDHDLLRAAATRADAVVHLAFNHDFSRFAENAAQDGRAIQAIGEALVGTDKALLVTSGVAVLAPGRVSTEEDRSAEGNGNPRRSEQAAEALAARGVRAASVRLAPTVHGLGETHGFVPMLIRLARDTGVSAYVGDGANRWPAVHRDDAARLYRLALETGVTVPAYHAIAEEGIPFREIAGAIGRGLGLPVEQRPAEHFGWFAHFVALDMPSSSTATRRAAGWTPTGPDLLSDLAAPDYFRG